MMDKKTFKRELVRMWDIFRHDNYKGRNDCFGVECEKCPLDLVCNNNEGEDIYNAFEMIESVEKWSREHQPKKFKVSRMEYDILKLFIFSGLDTYHFDQDDLLISLFRKGYFKGANEKMTIAYYFYNCEVEEDD